MSSLTHYSPAPHGSDTAAASLLSSFAVATIVEQEGIDGLLALVKENHSINDRKQQKCPRQHIQTQSLDSVVNRTLMD